jgi:3-dehydroquinate synthase
VIRVTAENGAYDIHCRWGALDDLGALLRDAGLGGHAFIITDEHVAAACGTRAQRVLHDAGVASSIFAVPPGESSKDLSLVSKLYDWLLDEHCERTSAVIALGGGVVGDLAGFVAATYLRGIPFVQAPTSLLAMVDASIGGKVAVDHPRGKNLIGAFYPPKFVVEDTSLLASLPPRSLREGFAEVIKHGFIMDPPLLAILERDADRLLAADPDLITEIVARNAALKAGVVSEDEREGGRRAILNYGHTVGHAIEAVCGYGDIRHGEAISAGMMAAAAIGERIGLTPPSIAERQARIFAQYGLPLRHPGLDVDAVLAATLHDKKVAGGRIRWVLLEAEGRPVLRDDVPANVVREAVEAVLSPA